MNARNGKATLNSIPSPIYYRVKISDSSARKTSEFFDRIGDLNLSKFDPSTVFTSGQEMSSARVLYDRPTRFDPFEVDERYTSFNDFVMIDNDTKRASIPAPLLPSKKYVPPNMTESKSEGNIAHRSGVSSCSSSGRFTPGTGSSDEEHGRLSGDTTASSAPPSRGRATRRVASPVKDLEDILEVQTPKSLPKSPSKRSRSPIKILFGENGWLGKSPSMTEVPTVEHRKHGLKTLGERIKKSVGNITDTVTKSIPTGLGDSPIKSRSRSPIRSTFQVSLGPPAQAKLYSEIELMICATANQYLCSMQAEQRMKPETLHKVLTSWYSKNRPQVLEFMFDQSTQRDLIQQNIETFCFYGPHAASLVAMTSMLQAWKSLAREMTVRTFCSPDSAVRKHLRDAYKVLEMLGAPVVTIAAFEEIAKQAKSIMLQERKRSEARKAMKFGVERRWVPADRESDEYRRREAENPFA